MTRYRYAILMFDGEDASLGQVPIEPDWEPALECARLQALRRHGRSIAGTASRAGAASGPAPDPAIEPLWHEAGAPYIRGFQVREAAANGDCEPCEFPLRYFHDAAAAVAKQWMEDGKLERGASYRYAACAFPSEPESEAAVTVARGRPAQPPRRLAVEPPAEQSVVGRRPEQSGDGRSPEQSIVEPRPGQSVAAQPTARFVVEELPARPPVVESSLADLLRGAELVDAGEEQGDADPPASPVHGALPVVLLPDRVLEEAAELARAAEGIETGGLLIGRLHHDPDAGELLVEITAQLPARHASGDATKLTFTAGTWTDARATLELRDKDEIMLGWWHSHPVRQWCSKCPLDRQRDCALARGFLSADDRALHRAIFPSAYSVALLASDVAFDDVSFSLFGWRQGRIERRGYHRRQEAARLAAASSTSGEREAGEANEEGVARPAVGPPATSPAAPAPQAETLLQISTPADAGGYAERPR